MALREPKEPAIIAKQNGGDKRRRPRVKFHPAAADKSFEGLREAEAAVVLYTWDESDSMGDPELDKHHQVLIGLINDLYTAMMNGEGVRAAHAIYKRLLEYTRFHFEAEEKEMYDARYPEFARHRAQHQNFTQQLEQLVMEFSQKDGVPAAHMLGIMRHWLRTHIRNADTQYAAWAAAHPAAAHSHPQQVGDVAEAPAELLSAPEEHNSVANEGGGAASLPPPDQATGERRETRAFS